MVFYDKQGKAIAYTEDGEHIYLFSGKAVAYIYQNLVYGYNGRLLGWFENGWIRDNQGYCVFFSEQATGGPGKPCKSACPIKAAKKIKPVKSIRQIKSIKPINKLSWSTLSSERFFEQ